MRTVQALTYALFTIMAALPGSGGCGSPLLDGGGPATSFFARRASASKRPGMGAVVYYDSGGGTMFRVWAPNASAVSVAGDWNGWSSTADPLSSEGNGNWSVDIGYAHPGHNYKYYITHAGGSFYRADPRARRMTDSAGNSIIDDPQAYTWHDGGYGMPGYNEAVIYEMHVGTFYVPAGWAHGTFQSAIQQLGHLQALGINLIELMPVAEFPTDTSEGYNVSDPDAPESGYGTPEDMKAFIDQAHQHGIGVILDVVHNHYGPNDLALWCFDGECYGEGGIYFYTDWRINTPWGPRPDYGRQEVRDHIRDNTMQWLSEYHLDGLRWDSTATVKEVGDGWTLMQTVNAQDKMAAPWKILIAEDFRNDNYITLPTFDGGAGFDSQWDSNFFHPVLDNTIPPSDDGRSMWAIQGAITFSYNGQATQRVIYTESHDEDSNGRQRPPEMIWPGNAGSYFSKKRSTLAAAIALTSPGIPMLFEGQEFLESGYFSPSTPLDWSKTATYGGIQQLYTDLIHLRRNWSNNTRGLRGDHVNVFHVDDGSKLIGYHRWDAGGPGDDVVVVANFANKSYATYQLGFPRGGTWLVRFNSDWNGYSSDFGNTLTYNAVANLGPMDGLGQSANIGIGPYTVVIFSQ